MRVNNFPSCGPTVQKEMLLNSIPYRDFGTDESLSCTNNPFPNIRESAIRQIPPQNPLNRILQLFLPLLTLVLTSCLATYRDFPLLDIRSEPLAPKNFPIYYHLEPFSYRSDFGDEAILIPVIVPYAGPGIVPYSLNFRREYRESDELKRVFAKTRIFLKAIATGTPPEQGVYCSIEVVRKPHSRLAWGFRALQFLTLYALPSFSGQSGYIVRYDLYVDKELKNVYRYEITTKTIAWLGLAPFAWVNFFFPTLDDAFKSTAYQFFVDADLDGYLKKAETPVPQS